MKTNQILTRKMGNFDVLQRTSDGMFNATALLKQWNAYSGQDKRMNDYFNIQPTKEFLDALKSDAVITASAENQRVTANPQSENGISFSADSQQVADRRLYIIRKGGKDGGATWMSDLVFLDFAMWLNAAYKVKVLQFVIDQLVRLRHDVGDNYNAMTRAIARIVPRDEQARRIPEIARAINIVIFNHHGELLRNHATERQMADVAQLERDIAGLIDDGFIKSYDELMNHLRRKWRQRHQPKELFNKAALTT
jgi:hypothetical protein